MRPRNPGDALPLLLPGRSRTAAAAAVQELAPKERSLLLRPAHRDVPHPRHGPHRHTGTRCRHSAHPLLGTRTRSFRLPHLWHFCSWLGLCPDNRISGGKILSVQTRKVKHRAATALRLAAQTLHRSDSPLGEFHRRMRARLGAPKAITATAHKLARLIYYLITTGKAYDQSVFAHSEHRQQQRRARRLQTQAAAMGHKLVPVAAM